MTKLLWLQILLPVVATIGPCERLEAQTAPGNVNDCTLIQDPIELRNCILRYGNVRTQPPATIESKAPPTINPADPSADPADGIVEVPSTPPVRANGPMKRSNKPTVAKQPVATVPSGLAPQTAPLPRPNPNDTLVRIEQIEVPKSRR